MTGMSLVTIAEDDYRELIEKANAAREERDRYKADSEALDFIVKKIHVSERFYLLLYDDCPEHLRKKLEAPK